MRKSKRRVLNTQRLLDVADWMEQNMDPHNFSICGCEQLDKSLSINGHVRDGLELHLMTLDAERIFGDPEYGEKFHGHGIAYNGKVFDSVLETIWTWYYFGISIDEYDYLFAEEWFYAEDKSADTLEATVARMRRLANGMTKEEVMEGRKPISRVRRRENSLPWGSPGFNYHELMSRPWSKARKAKAI